MPEPKLILLIEDNEDTRLVFSTMFNCHGYRIIEAENGETGVASVLEFHPDLIITDIDMPVMDGFAAARLIRADSRINQIPILVVSGNCFSAAEQAEARTLFDGCFTKPIQPSRVVAEVRRLIGPHKTDATG